MKRITPLLWSIALIIVLGIGIYAGHSVTAAYKDTEIMDLQAQLETANASLAEANVELAENRVLVDVWAGVASFYGTESGRITSDGTHFDGTSWTAAHRRLPAGTFLIVESVDTGRWAVVQVNDFGPARRFKDREIDLSRHVAEYLGIVQQGLARVRLYQIVLKPNIED